MNIEEAIKIVKKIRQDYNLYYPMDRKEVEAVETLLTAYEKEKEKNEKDIKFKRILADNFKRHIDSIIIGESTTFPCGWVYKKDLLDLIEDIKWTD